MQHAMRGIPRRVRLQLFPPPEAVKEDYPVCSVVCEIALDLNAVDFGEDSAKHDEYVRRLEEEQPLTQRLRLLLTAVNPSRLPHLDDEILAARQNGWSATFSSLLRNIPGHCEPVLSHLKVTIKQVFGVPREGTRFIDTYVVGKSQPPAGSFGFGDQFHTKTASPVVDPVIEETFQLTLLHGSNENLLLSVWDYDLASADDWVGEVRFPLDLLVRGIPTTRKLPVFANTSSSCPICWILVELTAIDFGLDEQLFRESVERAVNNDLPRLVKYCGQRSTAAHLLRSVEELLIQHVVGSSSRGGVDAYIRQTLVPTHGLEPGRDLLRVTLHSLQDLVAPSSRSKIDLAAALAASSDDQLRILVNGNTVPMGDAAAKYFTASATRLTSCPDAKQTITISIPKPQEDLVHITIIGAGHYLPAKDRSSKSDTKILAEVTLSLRLLQRNTARKRTCAMISKRGADKPWINGQIKSTS